MPTEPAIPTRSASPATERRRVLFVDDDTAFLDTVTELMSELSGGTWEILTARNASEAFQILQQRPVDLVVLDVEMQAIDGVQVLSLLNRSHPQLQKAVLTGYATENYRAACLAQGAELFLEKPSTPEGWASVHAALQQLLDFPPERGFRGVLRKVGLTEILQMECLGRSSSVLEVTAGALTGRIYVEEGQIVHAELGEHTGEAAFQRILALPGGQFVVHPLGRVPARTIRNSWEFLLMEAARVQDELRAELAGAVEERAGQPTSTVAGPEPVPAAPGQPAVGGMPEPAAPDQAPGPAHAPALDAGVSGGTGTLEPSSGPVSEVEEAPPPPASAVVICDDQGRLLYEWQCPDHAAWINLLEFVSQKARRLAPAEEFGGFDRLEVFEESVRCVILLRPGFAAGFVFGSESVVPSGRATGSARFRENPGAWAEWLRRRSREPGVVLQVIRFPDRTVVSDLDARDFSTAWLDHLGRAILDTYEVLQAHRMRPLRLRWRYERVTVDCARRDTGAVLMLFSHTAGRVDPAPVAATLESFRTAPSVE